MGVQIVIYVLLCFSGLGVLSNKLNHGCALSHILSATAKSQVCSTLL